MAIAALGAVISALAGPAWALTDEQLKKMTQSSPDFAKAQSVMQQTWDGLPAEMRTKLAANQKEWNRSLRDAEAQDWVDSGRTSIEGHILATYNRAMALDYYGHDRNQESGAGPAPYSAAVLAMATEDWDKAKEYLWPLALSGDYLLAQMDLGHIYIKNVEEAANYEAAAYFFTLAGINPLTTPEIRAELQYYLGFLYANVDFKAVAKGYLEQAGQSGLYKVDDLVAKLNAPTEREAEYRRTLTS